MIYRSKVSIVMGSQVKGQDGLTFKQRKLVDTLVTEGCSIAKASQLAGYAKGESGRVTASRTLRLPKVQEYYRSRVAEIGLIGAIPAVKTIVRLAQEAKSDYVKLEASKDILDRSGFKAPDKVQHQVGGNLSIKIDLD
jgi:phage terminase small subunit